MMAVNSDKPDRWKRDIAKSQDMYNDWFIRFAPKAHRTTRVQTAKNVEATLNLTKNLTNVGVELLRTNPSVLPSLRMSTCPPFAVDRLIGLADVSRNLVKVMEKKNKLPPRMSRHEIDIDLEKIGKIIEKMADPDVFVWLERGDDPSDQELYRAATVVADRLCSAVANPIIRNAQERRQLAAVGKWLTALGYQNLPSGEGTKYDDMMPGTFSYRLNVSVEQYGTAKFVNIPVDAVVMPKAAKAGDLPLLIEAKSAGDFTNVNKRRKEEAAKMSQLRRTYGDNVRYILLLCGYFDSGYLGLRGCRRNRLGLGAPHQRSQGVRIVSEEEVNCRTGSEAINDPEKTGFGKANDRTKPFRAVCDSD
jgi:type II restriction enzyme